MYLFAIMLMASMALLLTACDTPEPEPTPEPQPEPKELTFEVEITDVTKSTVSYTVTPSLNDADYMVVLVDESYIDNVGVGDALTTSILEQLRNIATTGGMTFDDYMTDVKCRGEISKSMGNLAHNSDYSLVIFGVDAAASWAATTEPLCVPFTTEDIEKSACTFEITAEVSGTKAEISVVPSDKNVLHHLIVVTKSGYDAYTDPAGEYKLNDASLYAALFQQELGYYATLEEAVEELTIVGDAKYSISGLNADTEYVCLVAGLLYEGGQLYIVTDIATETFTSEQPEASNLTFDIQVSNVEMNRADILITPSKLDETFTWACAAYDGTSTNEELMNTWISQNQMWFDWGMMLYTGIQDYTSTGPNYKYKVDLPDTDYYVLAVGYAGGITTEPEVAFFRTLPAPDPADATFQMYFTPTPFSVSVQVDSSDETSYYSFGVTTKESYNEEALIAEAEAGIQEMIQFNQMFNPDITAAQILSQYYWNGDTENNPWYDLTPETTYSAFVLVFNNDGTVAKCHFFEDAFTTKKVGNVTPDIDILGYYSGDEEAGAVFGQPEATAGKVIAVAHYTNAADMTALYAYTFAPSSLQSEGTELFGDIWGTLQYCPISLTTPYSFYVVDWNVEFAVAAIAMDANGVLGEIAVSELIKPIPEEKSNIEDLKALVAELNSSDEPAAVSPLRSCAIPAVENKSQLGRPIYKAELGSLPVERLPEMLQRPAEPERVAPKTADKFTIRPVNTPMFVRVR